MSEDAFTPGPWTVEPSMGGWWTLVGPDGSEIARFEWFEPSDADARLIAAAPEMYELLETWLAVYDMDQGPVSAHTSMLLRKIRGES